MHYRLTPFLSPGCAAAVAPNPCLVRVVIYLEGESIADCRPTDRSSVQPVTDRRRPMVFVPIMGWPSFVRSFVLSFDRPFSFLSRSLGQSDLILSPSWGLAWLDPTSGYSLISPSIESSLFSGFVFALAQPLSRFARSLASLSLDQIKRR